MKIDRLKKKLKEKPKRQVITPDMLLHSGSTLLNLACTNNPHGAFIKGKFHHIVGDSSSGKTFLSMTCLAEACLDPNFSDFRLIHDDIEGGNLIDIENIFPILSKRLEPPSGTKRKPVYSKYVEDLFYNIHDAIELGEPFIYIADSVDGLVAKADEAKFLKQKKAHRRDKDEAGSYGMAKAKIFSEMIRMLMTPLQKSGSIVIFISQTRANAKPMALDPKTYSGGMAMKFYATYQIWSSILRPIKKSVRGKDRKLGIIARVQVKKNRATGRDRTVNIPIYNAFRGKGGGFDDIGSCIDYLIEEKHWKKSGQNVKAPEYKFSGTREKLVQHIEANMERRYPKLQDIVGGVWKAIEDECSVDRRSRYDNN